MWLLLNFLLVAQVSALSLSSITNFISSQTGNSNSNSNSTSSGSGLFGNLQNTSFGQAVQSGINYYNNAAATNGSSVQSQFQNSSFGQAVQNGINFFNNAKETNGASVQQSLQNTSFGQWIEDGVEFYNSLTNGSNSNDFGLNQYVPFLANASAEAKTEFFDLLPTLGSLTIAQFEEKVNTWAAKYGYTEQVEKFNARAQNLTSETEAAAYRTVVNLELVLNNLKAIYSNKNQTFQDMHQSATQYISSLDETTQQIVFILFQPMLPPQLKNIGCSSFGASGNSFFDKAVNFFNGGSKTKPSSNSAIANFPMINVFLKNNNASEIDLGSMENGLQGLFSSSNGTIQIGGQNLSFNDFQLAAIDPVEEVEATTKKAQKKKNNKKNNNKNKNKKKNEEEDVPTAETSVI